MTDCAILIKNLVKIFDNEVTAIDNLNLNVKKGEIYGFLGPNGAGKTTSINILSGLLKPTSGEVIVGGFDVIKNSGKIHQIHRNGKMSLWIYHMIVVQ